MKIVVLGSTGMAGHVISQYFQERGHTVYRTSRSEKNTQYSAGIDVTDFVALGLWLDDIEPEVVINCVGLLQRACDDRPDLGVLINAYMPHWLERKYADTQTRVIQLSTDCVFSGGRGNYREDDVTDGTTVYDRAKALGELKNGKDLTFRMSIIGPDIDPKGIGLFNWFMMQSGQIQGYTKAIWNGVTTIELAKAIEQALQDGLTGLYHLVPNGRIDKCSLLGLFQSTFSRDDITVLPVDGWTLDKTLLNGRNDFAYAVEEYPKQIADMRDWVERHRELYPHYFR